MNILKYIFPSLRPKIMAKTLNMNKIHEGTVIGDYKKGETISGIIELIEGNKVYLRNEDGLLYKVDFDSLNELK